MTERQILCQVTKPGRYLGNEFNMSRKNWTDDQFHFALIFPDLYEIGMSHQGLQILYHLINALDYAKAERCYCPDIDTENLLRKLGHALTSLETEHALYEFDALGFTLPYELCYTNILTVLSLSNISFFAKDRDDDAPLIIGGGACAFNPEPVADFFDALFLGDGEEAVIEICQILAAAKKANWSKSDKLKALAEIQGMYIPSLYQPEYDAAGRIRALQKNGAPVVRRRILADLDNLDHLRQPIVPNAKIVHDRLAIEVARGCTRGCRFCQAGMVYRPVRERSPEQIMDLARNGIANSGFEELALLSLSTGDYSCLHEVLAELMDSFSESYVSVSMPSMRVGTLTEDIMNQIKRVRKTGFTLAPEAGSERLRRVINKGITEEDLLATCASAFALGWKALKLYFMIGLPTETPEDLHEIVRLCHKLRTAGPSGSKGKNQITASIGTFVPKPHTPFQWQPQISIDESRERIRQLRQSTPKGVMLKWHIAEQSYLEGVFSRGDRRLSKLIYAAWQQGARLDGWSDHFHLDIWRAAAETCGLDLDFYLRRRELNEILPWDHLSCGVEPSFIQDELAKGLQEEYTPDCRYHGCQQCGLCDFETIQPRVHTEQQKSTEKNQPAGEKQTTSPAEAHFRYMVEYSRLGKIAFLGHLEFLQMIFRSLRRAGITTNFSQGFNPSPKVSFGPALPVGTESHAEFFIMDLPKPLADPQKILKLLNSKLAPGVTATAIGLHSGAIPQDTLSSYSLIFAKPLAADAPKLIEDFMTSSSSILAKIRKGKKKDVDIRPLIHTCACISERELNIEIIYKSGESGVKPTEAAMQILNLAAADAQTIQIVKTKWQTLPCL